MNKKQSKSGRKIGVKSVDADLLKAAEMYKKQIESENRQRQVDAEVIMNLISEFFDSFILIGYDLTGASVKIMNAEKTKDKDALSTLMTEFINEKMNNSSDGDEDA